MIAGGSADRLNGDLKQLMASGIVHEQPAQSGRVLAFRHALVRDTAYQSLLKGRRQQLHAGIAEAIRKSFPALEKSRPELVALHLTDAGMITPALSYWPEADIQAFTRSANREAIAHLRHGLELVPSLQSPQERQRWERQLLAIMGPAVMAVEGYAAAESQRVFEKAHALIDGECPPVERLRIICGLWNLRSQQGELAAALPLAEDFLGLARQSSLGVELGNCMMGINLSAMGEFEPAHGHLQEVVESFRRGTQTPAVIFGVDELVLAHCYLARVLWSSGVSADSGRDRIERPRARQSGRKLCLGCARVHRQAVRRGAEPRSRRQRTAHRGCDGPCYRARATTVSELVRILWCRHPPAAGARR